MDKNISKLTITYTDGTQAHYTEPLLSDISVVSNYTPGVTVDQIMKMINSFYVKNNLYRAYDVEDLRQHLILNFGTVKSEHLGYFKKSTSSREN